MQELGSRQVRASRASGRITLLASLLLASTALAATPDQGSESKPEITSETKVHAAAPAAVAPIERPAQEGVLVIPRLPDPAPPAMPAELEEQRRASLVSPPAEPPASEASPSASVERIIIDTPPAPAFDLSILEREKRLAEEPAAPQQQAGPIVIETPPLPAFDLSSLKVEPPKVETPAPARRLALDLNEERLKSIVEPHRARLKLRPALTGQIIAAYAARNNEALWLDEAGTFSPLARAAHQVMSSAADDGLDPARFLGILPVSLADKSSMPPLAEDRRAETDVLFTLAAVAYAQDARGGRREPSRLSSMLTPDLTLPSVEEVIGRITASDDPDAAKAAFQAFNPQHQGYLALRQALAKLRAEAQVEPDLTASTHSKLAGLPKNFMAGAGLNPGQTDPRVPFMRLRLGLPAAEGTVYDPELAEAVREFQRANQLKPDGRVTPRTRTLLENLDSPVNRAQRPKETTDDRIAAIIANMERWRWLPPELGRTHIFVNIPEFRLAMMDDGAKVFETRVIVGKPERQTPVFSDQMEFLVVNPSWFIPPTILRKDVLPKLAADPGYAERMGYEVTRRGNSISVRQPPGERNALGHVKFMFPNSHAVYLHDTPGRHLFRNEVRAFSSGCVRVEGPFQLAEKLLLKNQGLTERQLRGMVGSGERTIRLTEKVHVHLAYFTVQVDSNGELIRQRDIYGHDARIRRALAL